MGAPPHQICEPPGPLPRTRSARACALPTVSYTSSARFGPLPPPQRRCFRTMTVTAMNFARQAREASHKTVMLFRNECDSIAAALGGAAGGSGGGVGPGAKAPTRRGGARRKVAAKSAGKGARYVWNKARVAVCCGESTAYAAAARRQPCPVYFRADHVMIQPRAQKMPFAGPSWPSSTPGTTGTWPRTSA